MNEMNVTEEWRVAVPYKEFGQFKVADIEKIAREIVAERKAAKQSMFITIAALKSDKFKELSSTLRFCADPLTGVMYGIMTGLLPDGNIKWRAVILNEMNAFNLNMLNDAITYAFIRMHPKVVGSPFQMGEAVYRILDEDRIAAQKSAKYVVTGQALQIAKTMKKDLILGFGRYLGMMYPVDASAEIIRASLFEHAATMPYDFMEKFNNPSRKYYEIIKTALVVGIISFDYEKGYKYKSIALGHSESDVLTKLIEDPSLLDSIKAESIKKDPTLKNLQKEVETDIEDIVKADKVKAELEADELNEI